MRRLRRRAAGSDSTQAAASVVLHSRGAKRPKAPFSAPVIAWRSAWPGTILFYPGSYSNEKALTPVARVADFNNELRKKHADDSGWLDRGPVRPVVLTLETPNVSERSLEIELVRLRSVTPAS